MSFVNIQKNQNWQQCTSLYKFENNKIKSRADLGFTSSTL